MWWTALLVLPPTYAYAEPHDSYSTDAVRSERYDPTRHVPVPSRGCDATKKPFYKPGVTHVVKVDYKDTQYLFRIYLPKTYNQNTPHPLVFQHPGWGVSAEREQHGGGVTLYADQDRFVSVTPQGQADNVHNGGPWYSWHVGGSANSPGPRGPTCTKAASAPDYCYSSCDGCGDSPQCDWTTCHDNGATPTGTGYDVKGFIPRLYDTLEHQLCIDTTREFAAGESNGGMNTYQLGIDLTARLAAIAPQFGSFHRGYCMTPKAKLPVIDLHGFHDTTIPANVSLAGNGWFYTPTHHIFNGGLGCADGGWKAANSCDGVISHYKTKYDGQLELYCISECSDDSVVRCGWDGGHNWVLNSAAANGYLVTNFLMRWTKPTHLGFGQVKGGPHLPTPPPLATRIVNETRLRLDEERLLRASAEAPVLHKGRHYGDPDEGCLDDEEPIPAGTGRVCAFIVHAHADEQAAAADGDGDGDGDLPSPMCHLGERQGCPHDVIGIEADSRARPTCLAKGNQTANPYRHGEFHCMLRCPCHGDGATDDCGDAAHAHCPGRSRCELGELRNRGHGVCTYHGDVPGALASAAQ